MTGVQTCALPIFIDTVNRNRVKIDVSGRTLGGAIYGIFGIFEPMTLKISNVDATFTRSYFETIAAARERVEYYELTTEIHYNSTGWDEAVVDRGLHELKRVGYPDGSGGYFTKEELGGDSRLDPIAGIDGEPVSEPILLNGDGEKLKDGEPPVYLKWRFYRQTIFETNRLLQNIFKPAIES